MEKTLGTEIYLKDWSESYEINLENKDVKSEEEDQVIQYLSLIREYKKDDKIENFSEKLQQKLNEIKNDQLN